MAVSAQILGTLEAANLTIELAGGGLKVTPASQLTEPLRQLIRVNKTALIDHLRQAANDHAGPSPEPWCRPQPAAMTQEGAEKYGEIRQGWPQPAAMTSQEVDTFTARLARFTAYGMTLDQAEALADRLVSRDRGGLDMGTCLECQHCTGSRCTAPARAGLGVPGLRAFDIQPVRGVLQRCPAHTGGEKRH